MNVEDGITLKTAVIGSVIGVVLGTAIFLHFSDIITFYVGQAYTYVMTIVEQVKQNPTVAALFALFGTSVTSVTMNALYKKAVTKKDETTNYLLDQKDQAFTLVESENVNLTKQNSALQSQVDQLINSQKTVAEVEQTFQNTISDLNKQLQDKDNELANVQSELRAVQPIAKKLEEVIKENQRIP